MGGATLPKNKINNQTKKPSARAIKSGRNKMKNFNFNEEKEILSYMVEALRTNQGFIVGCKKENHWKLLVRGGNYTSDYTYNLNRWGFSKAMRYDDRTACCSQYAPNAHIMGYLNQFILEACDILNIEPFKIDNIQFIWM